VDFIDFNRRGAPEEAWKTGQKLWMAVSPLTPGLTGLLGVLGETSAISAVKSFFKDPNAGRRVYL
jgi:hypothetical protein